MKHSMRSNLDPTWPEAVMRDEQQQGEIALPLFRPEAIRTPQPAYGHAAPLTPPSWRWITLGLAIVVIAFIAILMSASFARKETVSGRLRPAEGEFRVMPNRSGTVRNLFVKEGAIVHRGQPLFSISTETMLGSGATTNARLMSAIELERAALSERTLNSKQAAELKVKESSLTEQSLRAKATALGEQREKVERRLRLATEYLAAIQQLSAKGFARLGELKAREDAKLTIEQSLMQIDADRAELLSKADQAAAAAKRALWEARSEQNALQEAVSALSQRQVEAELQDSVVIRAARSGRITAIRATAGKAVEANRPAMTILASAEGPGHEGRGADLVADLYVPPRAIGFIEPGQPVRIMLDAFPYQQFGTVAGRVAAVPEAALAPEELDAIEGNSQDAVYLVTIVIPADSIAAYGKRHDLRAGMTLMADIILEERTLFEWIFGPLLAGGRRLL
ncbi:HlyD family secretion protein [Sphingomonas sp. DT-207]|uniref:HlyD family secretion protein n=1 Tax=Sphingomonas sp. DT-207 TaxID=3396167 RepID=UPI003F1CCAC2